MFSNNFNQKKHNVTYCKVNDTFSLKMNKNKKNCKLGMKLLVIMKPTFWCDIVRKFIEENFSDVLLITADWGDQLPESAYEWEGDYIISFLSPLILPSTILDKAKKAAINFHPAPPEYPGIGCYNFAIYDNRKEYGVTCHYLIERIDSGQIIAVKRFPMYGNESIITLKEKTMVYLTALFYEMINYIIEGEELPKSNESWSREPYKRTDFQELCTLNLEMSEEELAKRLNATYFPGALDYPNIKIGDKIYFLVDPKEIKNK